MKKQVNKLHPKREIPLSGDINKNHMNKLLEKIKAFCNISYQLYLKTIQPDKQDIAKQFESEPPKEFTKANNH